jgi:hypothetical protein
MFIIKLILYALTHVFLAYERFEEKLTSTCIEINKKEKFLVLPINMASSFIVRWLSYSGHEHCYYNMDADNNDGNCLTKQ